MNIDIVRLSSKGNIVIPASMRSGLNNGDKLVVIKEDNGLVIKKFKDLSESMKEDLEFTRRTEEAWKSYERGEFITQSVEEFLEDLRKC